MYIFIIQVQYLPFIKIVVWHLGITVIIEVHKHKATLQDPTLLPLKLVTKLPEISWVQDQFSQNFMVIQINRKNKRGGLCHGPCRWNSCFSKVFMLTFCSSSLQLITISTMFCARVILCWCSCQFYQRILCLKLESVAVL